MSERREEQSRRVDRRTFLKVAAGAALGVLGTLGAQQILTWGADGEGPYQQLDWNKIAIPEQISFATFEGVANAGVLPRAWKNIGVLVTSRADLDDQMAEYGSAAWQAVAYKTPSNILDVGTLPDGQTFLSTQPEDPENYAIGMRIGPGDLEAAIGLYVPERELFIPAVAGTIALKQTTTVDNIRRDYPGISYV